MLHIGVRRETENGDVLANFDVDGIDARIIENALPNSTCLRFIDPYGDTVMNQLQLPVLMEELVEVYNRVTELDLRQHIANLLGFLKASEAIHVYVRFTGD